MKGPSLAQIGEKIAHFFRRYHLIMFSLTIVISVTIAVFMLNNLLILSNASQPDTTVSATKFDQATIDKINKFATSSESPQAFSLPAGRINPLVD